MTSGPSRVPDRDRPDRSDVPRRAGSGRRDRGEAPRRHRRRRAAHPLHRTSAPRLVARHRCAACSSPNRSSRRRGCWPRPAATAWSRSTTTSCAACGPTSCACSEPSNRGVGRGRFRRSATMTACSWSVASCSTTRGVIRTSSRACCTSSPTAARTPSCWFGTHPGGPATIDDDVPLQHAAGELPYLLKVLAAAEPLSLQTHPTRPAGRAGLRPGRARRPGGRRARRASTATRIPSPSCCAR